MNRHQVRRGPAGVLTHLGLGVRRAGLVLGILLAIVLASGSQALADPTPIPTPAPPTAPPTLPAPPTTAPPAGTACTGKNAGLTAWCMDWAVHTATPPAGAPSHWLTRCATVGLPLRDACEAASLTLTSPAPDNSASVLLDGPPTAGNNAGLVACNLFADKATTDTAHAAAWTAKQQQCTQLTPQYMAALYVPLAPPAADDSDCDALDIACKVGHEVSKALAAGVSAGIQGLVDIVVGSMVVMLSKLAKIVFSATSIASPDTAFYGVYNSIAGVMILLVFVFFLISTIINGLRLSGPGPLSTIGGMVRAVIGISFAGGIAFIIVQAWDSATNALIDHNSAREWDPSWLVKGVTGLTVGVGTAFLALCIAVFSILGLVLLFIMMLFRGLLTTGAALLGAMAMTGQVMPETRHWSRRWFWTVNALASSKFFIAAFWIYGSRATVESDLFTSLKGLLLIWVMVLTPGVMLRLTTMWDGYLADVNARGVLSAFGNAGDIGAGFGAGLAQGLSGSPGGGPGEEAAGQMDSSTSTIVTTPTQPAGLDDGPAAEAADAIDTRADGAEVGDTSEPADGAQAEGDGAQPDTGDAGTPNADEADGVQAGTDTARQDAADGRLRPPGDAAGADTPPSAPQSGAGTEDGGSRPEGAGSSGAEPSSAGLGADATGTSPGSAGDSAGDASPTDDGASTGFPAGSDPGGDGPSSPDSGGGSSGPGGGGSAGGGSSAADAAAAAL